MKSLWVAVVVDLMNIDELEPVHKDYLLRGLKTETDCKWVHFDGLVLGNIGRFLIGWDFVCIEYSLIELAPVQMERGLDLDYWTSMFV